MGRIGEGRVGLLLAVVALHPHGRLAELAPQQAFQTVAIGGVVPGLLGAPVADDAEGGQRVGIKSHASHQRLVRVVVDDLVPAVDHAKLGIDVVVELGLDAQARGREVLDVDELVPLRPVGVGIRLDQLEAQQRGDAPHLELQAVTAGGGDVQGDVEVRYVRRGPEAEEPGGLDDAGVLAHQHLGVKPGAELRGVVRLVEHQRQRVQSEGVLLPVVQPADDRAPDAVSGVRVRSLGKARQLEPRERRLQMVHRRRRWVGLLRRRRVLGCRGCALRAQHSGGDEPKGGQYGSHAVASFRARR